MSAQSRTDETRRVLILSAAMGGGHMQVSHELARRLSERGHQVTVADLLKLMPGPTGSWLRSLYPWFVTQAPWLYDAIFRFFFQGRQRAGERAGVPVRLALRGLRRLVREVEPHVVVSTYHLAGLAAARLRKRNELAATAVTFNTTFGVHNLWLHPCTDLYLCITREAAAETARRTEARAVPCEPVVRPEFLQPSPPASEARRRTDFPSDARIALILAGALGMGAVEAAVEAVGGVAGWLPVVVCGRNEELRRVLEAVGTAVVKGWVDDMATLMAAADVVLDNAAGSSAKEALAMGVPVVTFRPIAGHGRYDARAMAQLGLTEIVEDERDLAPALAAAVDPVVRRDRVRRGQALFGTDPVAVVEDLFRERQVDRIGAQLDRGSRGEPRRPGR